MKWPAACFLARSRSSVDPVHLLFRRGRELRGGNHASEPNHPAISVANTWHVLLSRRLVRYHELRSGRFTLVAGPEKQEVLKRTFGGIP